MEIAAARLTVRELAPVAASHADADPARPMVALPRTPEVRLSTNDLQALTSRSDSSAFRGSRTN
jgi:hypothetical protein